ncbi:MAG: hypothetical protein AB1726_12140 [Planctomycetota bacterium]
MVSLTALWLPILLSAVFVFIASSVIHMVTPMHKGDMKKLPGEDAVLAALRAAGARPGQYMLPGCPSMKEMGSEAMKAKYEQGPVGFLSVIPNGPPAIGKNLIQWFVYCLVIGVFVAYVTGVALAPGADYLRVFRIAGNAAVLGYALGAVDDSIWKGTPWATTAKFVLDGIVYGLVTAGTFGWLWPAAA